MTTRLFIPESNDEAAHWRPGAVFAIEFDRTQTGPGSIWETLSDEYKAVHADRRPPLGIVLPSGEYWVVDQVAAGGGGWTVTGEPPNLTARPSVLSPMYHGWLTDGVLSDDLEGRTYEDATP